MKNASNTPNMVADLKNTKPNSEVIGFFPATITIRGEDVELEWDSDGECLGKATCTVLASDLDEGGAGGPVDGETFTIAGKQYKLGEHDYNHEGDLVACTARIYAVVEDFN